MADKIITQFLRFTEGESTEQVTWFKRADGTKYAVKKPFKAGRMDIAQMRASQYQEIHI